MPALPGHSMHQRSATKSANGLALLVAHGENLAFLARLRLAIGGCYSEGMRMNRLNIMEIVEHSVHKKYIKLNSMKLG